MDLVEAKNELNKNGYELIDEGFFGKEYLKYKNKVLKKLKKYGSSVWSNIGKIEKWVRDFFVNKMDPDDCVAAIIDHVLK